MDYLCLFILIQNPAKNLARGNWGWRAVDQEDQESAELPLWEPDVLPE
jgi:hypothetical protein